MTRRATMAAHGSGFGPRQGPGLGFPLAPRPHPAAPGPAPGRAAIPVAIRPAIRPSAGQLPRPASRLAPNPGACRVRGQAPGPAPLGGAA